MAAFNLAVYTIQIFSPEEEPERLTGAYRWSESDKRVLANLPAMMEAVEEDLTKLLPDGYRAITKEALS